MTPLGLLSIDPGLRNHLGWAYWWGPPKSLALYALGVDDPCVTYQIDVVVCELPQVYPGPRRNDPNDLIDITMDAGLRIGRIAPHAVTSGRVKLVKPRGWKGTVPKDVFTRRIDTAMKRLYVGTQTLQVYQAGLAAITTTDLRHNAIDAVGLGLWHQGHLR